MLKYVYTLATLLDYKSEVRNKYSPEMIISGLFSDNLNEMDWILSLCELELVYGFEIPDELYDRTDLLICSACSTDTSPSRRGSGNWIVCGEVAGDMASHLAAYPVY